MSVAYDPFALEMSSDAGRAMPSRRRPTWTSIFVVSMFMLATNGFDAVSKWQELPRDHLARLTVSTEGGRGARQVAFLLLGLWGVVQQFRAGRAARLWPPLAFAIVIFIGWANASIAWSGDRDFTVKRLSVFACLLLGVAGFVRRNGLRDVVFLMAVGGSIQMFASVAADLAWSTGGAGYRLSGLQHPNHSGLNAAFLVLASIVLFDATRMRRFLALAAVAAAVLMATKSRSSLFALLAALAMLAVIRCRPRRLAAFALGASIAGAGVLIFEATGLLGPRWTEFVYLGRADAEKTQLTGRPMIWAAAMEVFGNDRTRMLTGAGFDSFWTPETAEYVSARLQFGISEGHNGYFDMVLQLGVVGLACLTFVFLGTTLHYAMLARRTSAPWPAFAASVGVFAIVHGLTESTLTAPTFPTFVFFSCIALLAFHNPDVSRRSDAAEDVQCAS